MYPRTLPICITIVIMFMFGLEPLAQATDNCPDALPHQLVDAEYGLVTGDGLRMRDTPSLQGTLVTQLDEGQAFTVADGPTCADGYTWWQISFDDITGWVVQGDATEYWLARVDEPAPEVTPEVDSACPADYTPPFIEGDRIRAVGTKRVNLREDNSLEGMVLGQVTAADTALIAGASPVCNEDQVWWLVDMDGTLGWVLEFVEADEPLIQTHRFHPILLPTPVTTRWLRYIVSQDESRLIATKIDEGDIYIYDMDDLQDPFFVIPDPPQVRYGIAISSNGQLVALQFPEETTLWDIDQGIEIATVPKAGSNMILKDDVMLTNGFGLSVRLLDYPDLTEIWVMDGIDEAVGSIDWHMETNQVVAIPTRSSREIYLGTIGADDTTRLEPEIPEQDITCVRFHPSGDSILLGQFTGQMAQVFLDDSGETRVKQLELSHNPGNHACAISADGRYFAVPYWNEIYIWDLETDDVLILKGHARPSNINHLRFTEDGTQLLSATLGEEFFVWDMEQILRDETRQTVSGK